MVIPEYQRNMDSNLRLLVHTFAVLKTAFLQSGRMLMDHGGKL